MSNIQEYIQALDEKRADIISRIIDIFSSNLPNGFHKQINYNMPSFVVPHFVYLIEPIKQLATKMTVDRWIELYENRN